MEAELKVLLSEVEKYISEHQKRRDEWNAKVVQHRTNRDSINGQKRELYDEIERQRTVRDQENAKARESKETRREFNEKFYGLKDKLQELTGSGGSQARDRDNPEQIKRQMLGLERKYEQGGFLEPKEEKKFVATMKQLSNKLKELKAAQKVPGEFSEIQTELDAFHEQREKAHEEVIRAADAAQAAHDLMAKLRDETKRLNDDHEAAHRAFVGAKEEADSQHQQYIVAMRSVYSIRNLLQAKHDREAGLEPTRMEARPEAQDLMSALMAGQTLSTEQLMAMKRKDKRR
jgi:phosphoserine phosphatase